MSRNADTAQQMKFQLDMIKKKNKSLALYKGNHNDTTGSKYKAFDRKGFRVPGPRGGTQLEACHVGQTIMLHGFMVTRMTKQMFVHEKVRLVSTDVFVLFHHLVSCSCCLFSS